MGRGGVAVEMYVHIYIYIYIGNSSEMHSSKTALFLLVEGQY